MTGIIQGLLASFGGVISDAYFNLVTLLLPGNGTNGAQNNTFLDSSTNNFTITRNGNTTQGTFSPFSQTGWGNFFDGTGDYLSNTSTALITNTVSTFTVECWIYLTATPPADGNNISALCTLDGQPTGPTNFLSFGPKNDGKLYLFWFDGAVKSAAGGTALALNTWYHIACVVNSNAIQFYVNGVAETMSGTTTLTNRSGSQGNFAVGSSSAGQITGYISNFRVTTTAVYTSAFTPPTSALTNITNTKLLTCQSNQFVDNSSNAYALTVNGTPSVQAFSPFAPTAAYSAATVGGSGYFDGTGDYLTVPDNAAFTVGSGDYTLEAWVYPTASPNQPIILGQWSGGADGSIAMMLSNDANRYLRGLVYSGGYVDRVSTSSLQLNAWNHCAFVREGTYLNLYLNGTRVENYNWGSSSIQDSSLVVSTGASSSGSQLFQGNISNARFVKGTALYSGTTYTIPTAPLTNITNTQLLLNFTNAGITDATAKNVLETVGNAQISTTQSKFGGSSMYFDGTGDWVFVRPPTSDLFAFGTGDFTLECWVYVTTVSPTYQVIWDARTTDPSLGAHLVINSGKMTWWLNGASRIQDASSLSINTWYHVAVARSGTSTKMFINGTQVGSTYTDSNSYISRSVPVIGASFDAVPINPLFGYIDDFRITKGYARYTSNFTAPTAAFALQ